MGVRIDDSDLIITANVRAPFGAIYRVSTRSRATLTRRGVDVYAWFSGPLGGVWRTELKLAWNDVARLTCYGAARVLLFWRSRNRFPQEPSEAIDHVQ